MNATNLPDDPNVDWRPDVVASLILHAVESLDIQAIFTFDRDGVSSHPNHCAVYYAAASLCLANLLPKGEEGGESRGRRRARPNNGCLLIGVPIVAVVAIYSHRYYSIEQFFMYISSSLAIADCKFYTLDSINVVRKYLSIFDLLCTCFMSTHWYEMWPKSYDFALSELC